MRRVLIFIFSFVLSFSLLSAVKADDNVECKYGYGNEELKIIYNPNLSFNLNSSTTNPHITFSGYDSNTKPKNFLFVKWGKQISAIDALDINQSTFQNVKDSCACPSDMVVCLYNNVSGKSSLGVMFDTWAALFNWDWNAGYGILNHTSTLAIMDDEAYKKSNYSYYNGGKFCIGPSCEHQILASDGYQLFDIAKSWWEGFKSVYGIDDGTIWSYEETSCSVIKYTGSCASVNVNCPDLSNLIAEEQSYISKYKDCETNNSCKNGLRKTINATEDKIKSKCKRILSKYSYTGGEKGCIDACLSIKDTLDDYKKGTDLYKKDIGSGECGVSQRILNWINNIIRWVKYIVPVLVIVLGILDFMKAIGADKDDEFKKAQGKFVKRLIAAALIFIVPLILGFILEKMGFGFNSCGLF